MRGGEERMSLWVYACAPIHLPLAAAYTSRGYVFFVANRSICIPLPLACAVQRLFVEPQLRYQHGFRTTTYRTMRCTKMRIIHMRYFLEVPIFNTTPRRVQSLSQRTPIVGRMAFQGISFHRTTYCCAMKCRSNMSFFDCHESPRQATTVKDMTFQSAPPSMIMAYNVRNKMLFQFPLFHLSIASVGATSWHPVPYLLSKT